MANLIRSASAEFENGVLQISRRKRPEAQPKRVQIEAPKTILSDQSRFPLRGPPDRGRGITVAGGAREDQRRGGTRARGEDPLQRIRRVAFRTEGDQRNDPVSKNSGEVGVRA